MALSWQSFGIPELALRQTICRTFLTDSTVPTKLGHESLVALGWDYLSRDGSRKHITGRSKFKALQGQDLSFLSDCLYFKAKPARVGLS